MKSNFFFLSLVGIGAVTILGSRQAVQAKPPARSTIGPVFPSLDAPPKRASPPSPGKLKRPSQPKAQLPAFCSQPKGLPARRQSGSLLVESPPRPPEQRWLRLRTHQGRLSRSNPVRAWHGPEVPRFVPLRQRQLTLELLDPVRGGYLAFYRSRPARNFNNSRFEAHLFSCSGKLQTKVFLNRWLSRSDHLEVQDIRYADGTLYFNEACQTYSSQAGGRCSSLVAVDPRKGRLLWRTPPLTSNNVFRVLANHIVVGYGFTHEKSFVRLIRRSDGRVVEEKRLPRNHFDFAVRGSRLDVEIGGKWLAYRMLGLTTDSPKLIRTSRRSTFQPST